MITKKDEKDRLTRTLDIRKIRDIDPLNSIFYEALRHQAFGAGSRLVTEEVVLDDRYLLKKGNLLFMPNTELHFDPKSWGSNVDDFEATRFCKPNKVPSGAFRAWGGGSTLCHGRFFASTEILATVALLALKYDMIPVSGKWTHPGRDDSNPSQVITPPKEKVFVTFSPRKGWEDGKWDFLC